MRLLRSRFVRDTIVLQIAKVAVLLLTVGSSILVLQRITVTAYGTWSLAQSLLALLQSFNFLAAAGGQVLLVKAHEAGDKTEIAGIMGYFLQVGWTWSALSFLTLALFGVQISASLYSGDASIGVLAILLSLGQFSDTCYNLILVALSAQRRISIIALLTTFNQAVLSSCLIMAALVSPQPPTFVAAQLLYSVSTMLVAIGTYEWQRRSSVDAANYPALHHLFGQLLRLPKRRYLGYSALSVADKRVAALFTQVPLQLVGIMHGATAAGFLSAALSVITTLESFAGTVAENLGIVVPRAVQRGDYRAIQQNYRMALRTYVPLVVLLFAPVAVFAPTLFPLVFGDKWLDSGRLIGLLSIQAVGVSIGATAAPLYRSLNLFRDIVISKTISFFVALLPGWFLVLYYQELGGAVLICLIYLLTMFVTLWLSLRGLEYEAQRLFPK